MSENGTISEAAFTRLQKSLDDVVAEVRELGRAQAKQEEMLTQIERLLETSAQQATEHNGRFSALTERVIKLETRYNAEHQDAPDQQRTLRRLERQTFVMWIALGGAWTALIALVAAFIARGHL